MRTQDRVSAQLTNGVAPTRPTAVSWFPVTPFLGALLLTALIPADVLACGGCFSPPLPPGMEAQRVVQDSERILFVRDPVSKTSTVWVEVRYSGPAEDFAWVLPLPKKPKVGVGSSYLFDRLDQVAAPRFVARWAANPEGCRQPDFAASTGCGTDNLVASATGASGGTAGGPRGRRSPGTVTVLEKAQAGPYDYQVVDTGDAEELYTWLKTSGFDVPPSAKPIIADHIAKGDVFVAFKLKNGAGVDEIQPVTLKMHDTEPCVPMRLTSIAAQEDMAVTVYLAGPGRAVPKNHLHVAINPMRLSWGSNDGIRNYSQVLSSAIDEAGGRAFVTEYAGPMSGLEVHAEQLSQLNRGTYLYAEPVRVALNTGGKNTGYGLAKGLAKVFEPAFFDTAKFGEVKDLDGLVMAVRTTRIAMTTEVAAVLEKHSGAAAAAGEGDAVRTFWRRAQKDLVNVPLPAGTTVVGADVQAELESRFAAPMRGVVQAMKGATTLTRLAMRISPDEMNRDPIFAFNAGLPAVDPGWEAAMNTACVRGESFPERARIRIEGLGSWLVPYAPFGGGDAVNTAVDPRFSSAPAAMRVELLDETGAARGIHPSQLALVDEAILGAQPGTPSVSPSLDLKPAGVRWQPPPSDPPVDLAAATADVRDEGTGCAQGPSGGRGHPGATLLALLALALASLLAARRATRDQR